MFDKITPQTVLKAFNKPGVSFINTLDKADIIIQKKNTKDISCCYTKDNIDIKKIKTYKLIVLYCANYTCSASYNFAMYLMKKGIPSNKIALYEGGIHEWAMYSLLVLNIFTIISLKNKKQCDIKTIKNILKNYHI